MLTIREYKKAESLEEAYTLNQKKSNRVIGGMIWLKMETLNVGTAIDLSGLGLDTIEETETEFRIGAMGLACARWSCTKTGSLHDGAMRESVRHIVGVQLRQSGDRRRQSVQPVRLFRCADHVPRAGRTGRAVQGRHCAAFRVRRKTQGPRYSGAHYRAQEKCEIQLSVCAHQPDRHSGVDLRVR